jgi:hypothetical protein
MIQKRKITDKQIDILLQNHPDGRYDLKEISVLLNEKYDKTIVKYRSAKRKLQRDSKKWKRFLILIKKYWKIKREQRENSI